jgi:hypothetical protein
MPSLESPFSNENKSQNLKMPPTLYSWNGKALIQGQPGIPGRF